MVGQRITFGITCSDQDDAIEIVDRRGDVGLHIDVRRRRRQVPGEDCVSHGGGSDLPALVLHPHGNCVVPDGEFVRRERQETGGGRGRRVEQAVEVRGPLGAELLRTAVVTGHGRQRQGLPLQALATVSRLGDYDLRRRVGPQDQDRHRRLPAGPVRISRSGDEPPGAVVQTADDLGGEPVGVGGAFTEEHRVPGRVGGPRFPADGQFRRQILRVIHDGPGLHSQGSVDGHRVQTDRDLGFQNLDHRRLIQGDDDVRAVLTSEERDDH